MRTNDMTEQSRKSVVNPDHRSFPMLCASLLVAGCYSGARAGDGEGGTSGIESASTDPDDTDTDTDADPTDDPTDPDDGTDGSSGPDGGTTGDDGGDPPPDEVCTPPLGLYDTSSPSAVVGTGTPESCTGAALQAEAEQGGTIVFDCGPDPVTIALEEQIVLPIDRDTTIDGGGLVTLDGQSQTRHFYFEGLGWMENQSKVVLQRLTFINGAAPTGEYFPQDPGAPNCAYGYKEGSGGAVFIRDGKLHVLDSRFLDNAAALEGPDVGGGALYILGSAEVLISGSEFRRNSGSNGGAVGMLFANPHIYNSVFEDNVAHGRGANYVEPGCPMFNHDEQGGAGGNSGAVVFDGLNDENVTYTICGSTFRNNRANELGGALFRTPNNGQRNMVIDRCSFEANTARQGGATFIKDNQVTVRDSTFWLNRGGVDVDGNASPGGLGGLWINSGDVELTNSTFYDNQPSGLDVEGGSGSVRNATFVASAPRGGFSIDDSLFVDTNCNETLAGSSNLQWPEGTPCAGGVTFADPNLSDIGENGGPTPTCLPDPEGPAAGMGSGCPETDQRGEPRDSQSCAVGAVEP